MKAKPCVITLNLCLAALTLVGASFGSSAMATPDFGAADGAAWAGPTIEIRAGVEVRGEFATILAADGTPWLSSRCALSTAIDFSRLVCVGPDFDLELGEMVVAKGFGGRLTVGRSTYNVHCVKVRAEPNGVDGPVLQQLCGSTPVVDEIAD